MRFAPMKPDRLVDLSVERPLERSPRSGGPEHVSSILARVWDALLTRLEASAASPPTDPPPPPAQRPAA